MYKVLLADDDYQIIKWLETLIRWEDYGLELIGTACDGRTAFEMIKRSSPHIVLTDIVMPGMDGIELIRSVKEAGIRSKFIVLSFYTEHSYIKDAMKLGSLEYLIKDELNPQVLINSFQYAVNIIKNEQLEEDSKKKEKEIFVQNLDVLKIQIFTKLFKGYFREYDEFGQELGMLGIQFPMQSLVVAVIEEDHYADEYSQSYNVCESKDGFILDSALDILNREGISIVCKMEECHYACLISFKEMKSEMNIKHKLFSGFNSIISNLNQSGISVSIGISDLCRKFTDVYQYYDKCIQALKYKKFFKPGKILFTDQFKTPDDRELRTGIKTLVKGIHEEINTSLDMGKLKKQVKEVEAYFRHDLLSEMAANQTVLELSLEFSLLDRKMEEVLQGGMAERTMISGLIQYGDFYENFFKILNSKLSGYEKEMKQGSMAWRNIRWEIKESIQYLKENYDKKISLDDISCRVGMSKAYLSRLFKKEMGMNLEDFLLQYRMKIAADMLKSSNLKIYEIAINLGFCSTQHFINAFKKIYGTTPERYKAGPDK